MPQNINRFIRIDENKAPLPPTYVPNFVLEQVIVESSDEKLANIAYCAVITEFSAVALPDYLSGNTRFGIQVKGNIGEYIISFGKHLKTNLPDIQVIYRTDFN